MAGHEEQEPPDRPATRDIHLAPRPSNVCICFHVPLNKIVKYIRLEQPQVASQISNCYGAGTGCGWCIPFLERLYEALKANPQADPDLGMNHDEYLARRREYHKRINSARMRDERSGEGGIGNSEWKTDGELGKGDGESTGAPRESEDPPPNE